MEELLGAGFKLLSSCYCSPHPQDPATYLLFCLTVPRVYHRLRRCVLPQSWCFISWCYWIREGGGGEGFNLGNKYGLTGPGLLLPQHAGRLLFGCLSFKWLLSRDWPTLVIINPIKAWLTNSTIFVRNVDPRTLWTCDADPDPVPVRKNRLKEKPIVKLLLKILNSLLFY